MELQKAILTLKSYESPASRASLLSKVDILAFLLVTVGYLVAMLSVSLFQPSKLILFAAYPILMAPLCNLSYSNIFKNSLFFLPFIALIGILNPFYDRRIIMTLGEVAVSAGWISFFSIILRGLLAMQALLILIKISGFPGICQSLQRIGMPKIMTVQLLLLYRFIGVLMDEAHTMHQSMASRGFGRKSYPLKIWSRIVGSLLLRALDRSKRLHDAMLARGFDGTININVQNSWNLSSTCFVILWFSIFIILHFTEISQILSFSLPS